MLSLYDLEQLAYQLAYQLAAPSCMGVDVRAPIAMMSRCLAAVELPAACCQAARVFADPTPKNALRIGVSRQEALRRILS